MFVLQLRAPDITVGSEATRVEAIATRMKAITTY